MKSKVAIFFAITIFLSTFNLFSETSGAVEASSFGVFRSQYGDAFNASYWQKQNTDKYYFQSGLYNDFINFAWFANYFGAYWGAGYNARIINHGFWPQNRTDMLVNAIVGIPSLNLGIHASYFDKNIYRGVGTAAPKLEIGKTFDSMPLVLELDAEWKMRYWTGFKMDVLQMPITLKADYSEDGMKGFGASYTIMPTIKASHGKNSTSGIAPMHGISLWAGWFWQILDNFKFGGRPNFTMNINCINTTNWEINKRLKQLYDANEGYMVENLNWIPENGNVEFRLNVPIAFIYDITEKIEFIAGLKFGFYYANFDHLDEKSEGGSNLAGTVNETGIGFATKIEINKHATFQIGTSFVRQLSVVSDENKTGDKNDYPVESPSLSLDNLFKEPLTASLTLKF